MKARYTLELLAVMVIAVVEAMEEEEVAVVARTRPDRATAPHAVIAATMEEAMVVLGMATTTVVAIEVVAVVNKSAFTVLTNV